MYLLYYIYSSRRVYYAEFIFIQQISTSRRTGNRARKNNVFQNCHFSHSRHFCKPNCAKFSHENLAKIAFRVSLGFISLGHIDRRFLSFFSKQGLQRCNCFFAGDGYADSHISTASTSHRGEDLCSLLPCPPHPTPPHPFMYTAKQHYQTSLQRSNM